ADRLIEQLAQLAADRDAPGLPRLAGGLMLLQGDDAIGPVHVGDRRPAEFSRSSAALSQGGVNQAERRRRLRQDRSRRARCREIGVGGGRTGKPRFAEEYARSQAKTDPV